jgi:hypothetical protein
MSAFRRFMARLHTRHERAVIWRTARALALRDQGPLLSNVVEAAEARDLLRRINLTSPTASVVQWDADRGGRRE